MKKIVFKKGDSKPKEFVVDFGNGVRADIRILASGVVCSNIRNWNTGVATDASLYCNSWTAYKWEKSDFANYVIADVDGQVNVIEGKAKVKKNGTTLKYDKWQGVNTLYDGGV